MTNKSIPLDNSIDAQEADYLYKQTSQIPGSGFGLYTAIDLFEDEIIAVFTGEILSDSEAQHRADENRDQYFISLLDGRTMDSLNSNCFAKYANDAAGSEIEIFSNNAKIGLDEENNVCVIAINDIKSGAEIFCAYGKQYWKKHGGF